MNPGSLIPESVLKRIIYTLLTVTVHTCPCKRKTLFRPMRMGAITSQLTASPLKEANIPYIVVLHLNKHTHPGSNLLINRTSPLAFLDFSNKSILYLF